MKKSEQFSEKLIYSFSDSAYSSNHWRSTCKKSWGCTFVCRFLQGIHREKMEQILLAYGLHNCYNEALQRPESKGLLIKWWYWFLWHCPWSLATRYIGVISIYDLTVLCTANINRSIERKWFHTKKKKKIKSKIISSRNYYWCRQCTFCKYTCSSQTSAVYSGTSSKMHQSLCKLKSKTKFVFSTRCFHLHIRWQASDFSRWDIATKVYELVY